MAKYLSKKVANLINTVKRLEPLLQECNEDDIIIMCLSDKITHILETKMEKDQE